MVNKKIIYALSTPPGRSAIAVIRISGRGSHQLIKKISSNKENKTNKALLNSIYAKKGEIIDQTITTYFKSPKSYTGEDMVEISMHGGHAVVKKFTELFSKIKNVNAAAPGEFTRRAFENNKLDLTQVEAIADIVNSETEYQRKQAMSQLQGATTIMAKKIYEKIKKLLADTEAVIDFADEDLPNNIDMKNKEQTQNIIYEIEKIIKTSERSRKIRDGFVVGIIGKTNTGKSSFINNISNHEIAIVSDEHGTTRDSLESYLDIKGLPVRFIDTAGLRNSKNKIEKIGMSKSKKIAENSDLNLVFIEKIRDVNDFKNINNPIFVQSKKDIIKNPIKNKKITNISSKTSYGIYKLLDKIYKILSENKTLESSYISRERHLSAIKMTQKHLEKSLNVQNYDLFSENIRLSLNEISKIYGVVDIEDILDIIFSDYCIGK